jgi:hypothetical protein
LSQACDFSDCILGKVGKPPRSKLEKRSTSRPRIEEKRSGPGRITEGTQRHHPGSVQDSSPLARISYLDKLPLTGSIFPNFAGTDQQ